MTKNIVLFVATFIVGALIALAARTALHKPFTSPTGHTENAAYAPMVNNSSPAAAPAPVAPAPTAPLASEPSAKTVNTLCAICGMDVDPDLPTATYQGKVVGFGCKACPSKFAANPDRYGSAALRNEVIKE
jgi:YHS domain-containing protein